MNQTEANPEPGELGTLVPVEPRSLWPDEAGDFTPWIRDNIERIGTALGIRFDTVTSEEPVGRFNADLWGQEEGTSGRSIVIENQLTDSNHDHLGKLLTYGAGLNADILVWVAPRFRDEHLDALKSLNESSVGRRHYFAVQVEVFRIGDSNPAPFFRVLVSPPNWTQQLRPPRSTPSPRMQAYHEFFDSLLTSLKERDANITQMSRVGYQSWLGIPTGRSGYTFVWTFTRGQKFRVELYIDPGDKDRNKQDFEALESQREDIEQELGNGLAWERLEDARASRIALYTSGSIDYSSDKLNELSEWAIESLLNFRNAFGVRIRNL